MATTVPLSNLHHDEKANVRKAGRGVEPEYVASIRAKGVIEALIVRPNGDGYTVTNGGKRLSALQHMLQRGEIAADYPVKVDIQKATDAEAREVSLTTNLVRSDMHPVQEFRAFAQMVKDGKPKDAICAEYVMTPKELEQVLALGQLSPQILDAWLAGTIDKEDAQAFTLAPDQKAQNAIFEKLSKRKDGFDAGDVKQELKANEKDGGRFVEFVGVDEYISRGGKVTRDLFGSDHVVSNVKLAKAMATEKIAETCEMLVKAGWAWALPEEGVHTHSYGSIDVKLKPTDAEAAELKRLEAIDDWSSPNTDEERDDAQEELARLENDVKVRSFTAEQKAKSGCFVSITSKGKLMVEYGRVKPDEKKKVEAQQRAEVKAKEKKKRAAKGEPEPTPDLSQAAVLRLTEQLTRAASEAIEGSPELAMDFALAALLSNGFERTSVCLSNSGMGAAEQDRDADFGKMFAKIHKMTPAAKRAAWAAEIGASFNFRNAPQSENEDVALVCETIPAKAMNKALRDHFDAQDYFDSVPKALCLQAITEAINVDEARKVAGKPKGEIAKFCVTNVPKTGWLPELLRTENYDGPKAKAKKGGR